MAACHGPLVTWVPLFAILTPCIDVAAFRSTSNGSSLNNRFSSSHADMVVFAEGQVHASPHSPTQDCDNYKLEVSFGTASEFLKNSFRAKPSKLGQDDVLYAGLNEPLGGYAFKICCEPDRFIPGFGYSVHMKVVRYLWMFESIPEPVKVVAKSVFHHDDSEARHDISTHLNMMNGTLDMWEAAEKEVVFDTARRLTGKHIVPRFEEPPFTDPQLVSVVRDASGTKAVRPSVSVCHPSVMKECEQKHMPKSLGFAFSGPIHILPGPDISDTQDDGKGQGSTYKKSKNQWKVKFYILATFAVLIVFCLCAAIARSCYAERSKSNSPG